MEISFKQTLFSIDPKNKRCVDCGEKNVAYVSINNGVTICELCAQIHRQLGPEYSSLHKIDEELDDDSMNFFIYGGNKNFKKTLKEIGVNLDMQRTKLYKTYGLDYYRKCLLSKVKGVENTEKCQKNPNEIMNSENKDNKDKENEDNKNKEDKNSVNNINNFLNINNNLGNKTNVDEEDNGESHVQLNHLNSVNLNNNVNKEKSKRSGLLRKSMDKVRTFGGYIKKNSTKGIVAIKKAGTILVKKSKPAAEKIKSTAKSTARYMGEHMPYFHKHKVKSQEDIRSDNYIDGDKIDNDENKKDGKENEDNKQIEF